MTTTDESAKESYLDDTQGIDLNIENLRNKYITPIDNIRSRNTPNVSAGPITKPDGSSNQPDTGNSQYPQESRAHAYYRALGLPVIAKDGRFYNPGFNPKKSMDDRKEIVSIAKAVDPVVRAMHAKRELEAQRRQAIFQGAGLSASLFSTVLSIPAVQKKFMVMKVGADPLSQDPQDISIPNRVKIINQLYQRASTDQSPFTAAETFATGNSHVLRPFTTDPVICATIKPSNYQVCVPFPETKDDRAIGQNVYLKRCGLEFILRLRLRQRVVLGEAGQGVSLKSIEALVGTGNNLDKDKITQLASVLADIDPSTITTDQIKGLLNDCFFLEVYTLDELVRTLKGVISLYIATMNKMTDVIDQIIWIPQCGVTGPESGTDIVSGFITPKTWQQNWVLERRILGLEARSQLASSQRDLGPVVDAGTQVTDDQKIDYSDFIIAQFNNVANTFEHELEDCNNQKKSLIDDASSYLKTMELISGEVSGFGLIDLLAVYLALWSLDIKHLLNLIDDAAVERLYENYPELVTDEVEARQGTTGDALGALVELDSRIVSILSYADTLLYNALSGEKQEGGTP